MRFDHSERPPRPAAFGLMLGFGGVIVLVGVDIAGNAQELLGAGAILLAACGYAVGPMVIKHRLAGLDPRATMGTRLAIAALVLAPGAAIDRPHSAPTPGAIGSVVVLGLLCTALAFVIFTVLIREAGTSRATVITYVNPVVAVALGVALLGERPGAGAVAGLLLILAGSWLSTDGRLPPPLRGLVGRRRGYPGAPRRRAATIRRRWLITILSVVQVLICIVLIFLVLMHSGKDAGLSGAFGVGTGAGPLGGGSLVERNLNRWTIGFAIAFAVNTIILIKIS